MRVIHLALIIVSALSVVSVLAWAVDHYYGKYQQEKIRAESAEQKSDAYELVTSNVLRTVSLMNVVVEMNQHAKQQIALESQRAASDIKTAVAGDDCAVRTVPAGAAQRLHDYADGLRNGATSSAIVQPDR